MKSIIRLRGLWNESLIEETGFVSKVNEFEIDSSEKLERHGVTRLKGEVNELPATETIHSDVTPFPAEKRLIFVPILELFHM